MPRITTLATTLLAAALVAGCGDDDEDAGPGTTTAAGRATATAPPADGPVAEIDAVRELLDDAAARYAAGDARAAERLVGDAYLEHFEEVEHPLEERDPELMESLEKTISTTIRDRIKAGAPEAEVERLIDEAKRELDKAEAALR